MVDTFLTALAAASSFCSEMSAGAVLLGLAVGGAAGACVWAFAGAASAKPAAARVVAQKPIIDFMLGSPWLGRSVAAVGHEIDHRLGRLGLMRLEALRFRIGPAREVDDDAQVAIDVSGLDGLDDVE